MKVIVTGGCGYKGHILVPKLLNRNYHVKVIDNCWFGNYLKPNPRLIVEKRDIRTIQGNGV